MAQPSVTVEIPFKAQPHQFVALVQAYRVVDGDTVDVKLDLGFSVVYGTSIRVFGIDTPELHRTEQKAAALISMQAAQWWLNRVPQGRLMCESLEPDKYGGRWLGTFYDLKARSVSLSNFMLYRGYARSYQGEAKPPWTTPELQAILDKGPPH